jgi:hypothetical protein
MAYQKYVCLFMAIYLSAAGVSAQSDSVQSAVGRYFFDGPCIAFEFDPHTYASALRAKDSIYVEFTDLNLLEGITHPESWSKEGWSMVKSGPEQFQIRKNLTDFKDKPNWLLRLLSANMGNAAPDSVLLRYNIEAWSEFKNPNIVDPVETEAGNVLFQLKGFTHKKQMILTGSFNHWDEKALPMRKTADGWALRLQLQPGLYHYKFIADGEWMHDPGNKESVINEYNTLNSILEVGQSVRFYLRGYPDAQKVILAGSFNHWDKEALRMQKTDLGWAIELTLKNGKHKYKYIVDGKWILDPGNQRTERDREGNENSVLLVK